jgi:predicted metalloendopeptidase
MPLAPVIRTLAFFAVAALMMDSSTTAATPHRPIRGVDPAYMDLRVAPEQDFYNFANGAFNAEPIPGEYASYGVNQEIDERNYAILREILESSARKRGKAGSLTQRVGDFYAAGMDEAAIEQAGLKPLEPWLQAIAAIQSPAQLQETIGRLYAAGYDTTFAFGVQIDDKDTTSMIAAFAQGGLGLPERDYYTRDDEKSGETRQAYAAHIARTLEIAGDSAESARRSSEAILGLETKLAKASRTLVERRDPERNYNKFERAALAKVSPTFDWEGFFSRIGLPPTEKSLLVGQPEFFASLGGFLRSEPIDTWRAYLRWQVLHQASPYLGRAFVEERFAFFGRKLSGATELKPRWKRVLLAADEAIGEDLGQLYVKRAFSPRAKARALEMVRFHLQAMRDLIQSSTWMCEATKAAAFRKIDTMRSKIGYPDRWRDYSGLTITRASFVENMLAASAFESRRQLAKLGKPVDRTDWLMTPQMNNAYYEPTLNEMCFPAGILQPPFFDEKADDASNYGALASTIGHELTHGFDDQGRQYDAEGNLKSWWTEADVKAFEDRAAIVVRQYNAFEVLPGLHINGEQTLGENIADIGGLRVSFEAYKLATRGKRQKTIDGFTPEQRFFIAFAQGWRTNQRQEQLRLQVTSDVHSPIRWRVLGPVANFPEFRAAFRCAQPAPGWPSIW